MSGDYALCRTAFKPWTRTIENGWLDRVRSDGDEKRQQEEEACQRRLYWEELELQRWKELRLRQQEEARQKKLIADAEAWSRAELLREYTAAHEYRLSSENFTEADSSQISRWLAWTKEYADSIDPFKRPPVPFLGNTGASAF